MRVIAGTARGRVLKAPRGLAVRPTTDRVREAMFSSLGGRVDGAAVLDLYAGSGALGIEALSRGAARATFVEHDATAVAVLTQNLQVARVEDRATVVRADVHGFARRAHAVAFDLVLCDPPYELPLADVAAVLDALAAGGGLASDATVVIERDKRDPGLGRGEETPPALRGLLAIDRRRSYGDTVLLYCEPTTEA